MAPVEYPTVYDSWYECSRDAHNGIYKGFYQLLAINMLMIYNWEVSIIVNQLELIDSRILQLEFWCRLNTNSDPCSGLLVPDIGYFLHDLITLSKTVGY